MIREYSNNDSPNVIQPLRKNTPEYFDSTEQNDFDNEVEDNFVYEKQPKNLAI